MTVPHPFALFWRKGGRPTRAKRTNSYGQRTSPASPPTPPAPPAQSPSPSPGRHASRPAHPYPIRQPHKAPALASSRRLRNRSGSPPAPHPAPQYRRPAHVVVNNPACPPAVKSADTRTTDSASASTPLPWLFRSTTSQAWLYSAASPLPVAPIPAPLHARQTPRTAAPSFRQTSRRKAFSSACAWMALLMSDQ